MYYVKTIEDKVRVAPEFFKEKTSDAVQRILRDSYERRLFKELGIVLSVFNTEITSKGVVIPGDGAAYYTVKFDTLTFTPVVNEVYDIDVVDLVDFGAFVSIGPIQGLVHISQISPEKFMHNKKLKKLVSKSGKKSVKKGDAYVAKVSTVSLKSNISETKVGITMRPIGLGRPEWYEEIKKKPTKSKEETKEDKK